MLDRPVEPQPLVDDLGIQAPELGELRRFPPAPRPASRMPCGASRPLSPREPSVSRPWVGCYEAVPLSAHGLATGIWLFPEQPAPVLVDVARHAERRGIDELWLGDEGPAREPFAVLAAAAEATEGLSLAVGVTNPYVRHPGVAAASMLTIHELSGGRAVLGVGAGGQMSLAPFGIDPKRPLASVRRFVDVVRGVAAGTAVEGYTPPDVAVTGSSMPIYVGARSERLNRFASEAADGAFVAGMPPFRYAEVLGWVRSVRPIDVALYPSVAFGTEAVERHRPEMIWSLVDAPREVRGQMGLADVDVEAAAVALREGDREPARQLIDDETLARLMLIGEPDTVGAALAELVRQHRPTSIGLALLQDDLHEAVEQAAGAFAAMRRELA